MPWDAIGALFIVSGAFGLFRRDVVEEVGGYWVDTVGENLEMTVRMDKHMRDQGRPYRITFTADPVCWTEAPSDMATLGSQRRRWHRGLWESLWRHRSMMLRPGTERSGCSRCGLEEGGYRNYRRSRDLGRMFTAALFENMWFRQLVDLYRLQGVWDLIRRRNGWGAMKRRGIDTA